MSSLSMPRPQALAYRPARAPALMAGLAAVMPSPPSTGIPSHVLPKIGQEIALLLIEGRMRARAMKRWLSLDQPVSLLQPSNAPRVKDPNEMTASRTIAVMKTVLSRFRLLLAASMVDGR